MIFMNWSTINFWIHLVTVGVKYTWSNNRVGRAFIAQRLERALCNDHWIDSWSFTSGNSLAKCHSDHSGQYNFVISNCWFNDKDVIILLLYYDICCISIYDITKKSIFLINDFDLGVYVCRFVLDLVKTWTIYGTLVWVTWNNHVLLYWASLDKST